MNKLLKTLWMIPFLFAALILSSGTAFAGSYLDEYGNMITTKPVSIYSRSVYAFSAHISPTQTSVSITPTPRGRLLKFIIGITDDGRGATAGDILVTVTLNGSVVYQYYVYIPSSGSPNQGTLDRVEADFFPAAPYVGLNGTLVVTISSPLTAGYVDINAYFDK